MMRENLPRKAKNAGNQIPNETSNSTKNKAENINLLPMIIKQNSTEDKLPKKLNYENLHHNLKKSKNGTETKDEPAKKKLRAKVDLKMMEEELKQLEDPPTTSLEKELTVNRLTYDFFNVPCEDLAQNLLGKILVRRLENGVILKGRIVETESYLGGIDKASQTYQNRITPRIIPMYMIPGTIYIYLTYGMYCCFNISSQGEGAAILLRGIEPTEGIEEMMNNRASKLKSKNTQKNKKTLKTHEICNGPSKLCIAYDLNRNHCKYSMCTWKGMWIEDDPNPPDGKIKIVKCARIGIDSVGPEWANKPLRFYIYGNTSVSKRNKKAEASLIDNE